MTDALIVQAERYEKLQVVLMKGDLSILNAEERSYYYNQVCESLGLNPLTKPFDYMKFQGRELLYANKNCAEQLRSRDKISIQVVSSEVKDDLYIVVVRAISADGRQDEDVAAIPIANMKGLDKSNAIMKCMTKAKRRVTLSICGLGMLDETEVDDNPQVFTKIQVEPTKALENGSKKEDDLLPTPTLDSIMTKYTNFYKIDRKAEKSKLWEIFGLAQEFHSGHEDLKSTDEFISKKFLEVFGEKSTNI